MRLCCSFRFCWAFLQGRHPLARVRQFHCKNVSLFIRQKEVATALKSTFCTDVNMHGLTVLGIETSCDDTGAAVVNDRGDIVGEALHSQTRIHVE